MERAEIIRGYSPPVNASCLNVGLVVFVEISLERKSHELFREFREFAMELAQVQECFLESGDFDYLIKARVADMDEYRQFLGGALLSLPGVRASASWGGGRNIKTLRKNA